MRTTRACATLIAAVVATASLAAGAAVKPTFKEEPNKFVLDNEVVTVWFQGKKPFLRLAPAGVPVEDGDGCERAVAGNAAPAARACALTLRMRELVEYRDVDDDGLPSATETVARLDFDAASGWKVEHVSDADSVVLNLTLDAPVKIGAGPLAPQDLALPDRNAVVSLVFTIRSAAAEVRSGDVVVPVPATAIKFDVIVTKWPFVDAASNRLALETSVSGALEPKESGGIAATDVEVVGASIGRVTWPTVAQGTTASDKDVDVPVRAEWRLGPSEKEDARSASNASRLVLTYDAPDLATIVHDPTVGIAEVASEESAKEVPNLVERLRTPAPGAIALGVAAAIAVGVAAATGIVRAGRR